ncbi:MAG: hypothetical protein ACOC80_15090, partial [Petrotogales bacterium]
MLKKSLPILVVGILVLSGVAIAAITSNKATMDNHTPDAPTITGPSDVPPGTYEYTFKATDPDGDDVSYFIDWGDGNEEQTGFHGSGEEVKLNHTFLEVTTYFLKAKAIDPYDYESEWGYLLVRILQSTRQSITISTTSPTDVTKSSQETSILGSSGNNLYGDSGNENSVLGMDAGSNGNMLDGQQNVYNNEGGLADNIEIKVIKGTWLQ